MTIHFVKPRWLSQEVTESQILPFLKQIELTNLNLKTRLWVHESDQYTISEDTYKLNISRHKVSKGDIIYSRNPIDYSINRIMLSRLGVKFLYDFRALVSFESWYRNRSYINFTVLFILEFFAYFTADQLNCVSNNLSKKLKELFLLKRRIKIIPCLTSAVSMKNTISKSTDMIDFVYIGGTNKWQCIEDVFKCYSEISQHIPNTRLTIFTKNYDIIHQFSLKYQINVKTDYVHHSELHTRLKQYNFGFLIREKNIINRVASPIKLLEYIGAGVIPILSEGVGDYSNIILKERLGLVFNKDTPDYVRLISDIKMFKSDLLINIRLFNFANKLTWANYNESLIDANLLK